MSIWRILIAQGFGAALLCCAAAPAQGQNAEVVPYTFKAGDTLIGFANRYLTGDNAGQMLQRMNNIGDATRIRPGTVISVPTSRLKSTIIGAKIVAFSGSVTVTGGRKAAAAVVGGAISEGHVLTTGAPGFLTLSIAGGSNVSIPSRSRVRVVKLRRYLLTGGSDIDILVEQGRAETAAAPIRDSNSSFRMRTPTAVSAVRGTVFRIGYEGPESPSLTEVVEGAVAVGSREGGSPTMIPTGFGASLPKTGKLFQEQLLPAPQVLDARAIQIDDAVNFKLSAIPGAKGYRTQLARDAGFLQIFAETVSTGPLASFETVPDGNFYVRSMAIAHSGLEGLSENAGFRRRQTSVKGVMTRTPNNGGFRFNWTGKGSGSAVYRFQLLDNSDRSVPVIDEPGLKATALAVTNLPRGSYTWRVAMQLSTSDGVIETWSGPQDFVVGK